MDKFLGDHPLYHRDEKDGDQKQNGGCRSVVDLSLIVEHPINVVHDGDSGVSRAGGSAGIGDEHGIDLVESAGHVNHGHQNHHPDGGTQQGQRNAEQCLRGGGAVDPCSLIDLLVNLLQTRQKQKDLKIVIGRPLILSQAFPPLHTVRASFPAHGVPSVSFSLNISDHR